MSPLYGEPDLPRPRITIRGEDADLELPGILLLEASYLAEGLYDPTAGGMPDEEDLYEVEATHLGGGRSSPVRFAVLLPAARPGWPSGLEELSARELEELPQRLPIESFLLALAAALFHADPARWEAVCEEARHWDPAWLEPAETDWDL